MGTKKLVVLQYFFHREGGQPALVFHSFSVDLVHMGAVTSQLIVWKFRKCDVQGADSVDITIGDNSVHSSAQLVALPKAVALCLFEKVKGDK